jgi:hypothetical protein
MKPIKILAILLVAAGTLGLLYGGFRYTKDSHDLKLGPVEVSVKEKKSVSIPMWMGVGAIVLGGLLLLGANRKT